ncbi:MAG TPA: CAAX prenyl protease-related protein, partial [Telluria sp.]|nr:CAAX prenyl protease-related protein [Telluria sp.]
AAGVTVLLLWINLNAGWMTLGQSAGFDPVTDGRIDWLLVAARIAGAALVVPVMEELFWRSYLMRWIASARFLQVRPAQLGLRSFVVTVVLFGFEHNLWLAGIVAGAVYSVLYMRSGTLWSPILAHGVTNGLLGAWIISTGHWTYW